MEHAYRRLDHIDAHCQLAFMHPMAGSTCGSSARGLPQIRDMWWRREKAIFLSGRKKQQLVQSHDSDRSRAWLLKVLGQ
jgi:hypothetical protein